MSLKPLYLTKCSARPIIRAIMKEQQLDNLFSPALRLRRPRTNLVRRTCGVFPV
jgi:hypothetical protein